MNPTIYVLMVTAQEMANLREDPESVQKVNREGGYYTCFEKTIIFFLTKDADPDDQHPLAVVFGTERIECASLKRGEFHLLPPTRLQALAKELASIDLEEVKERIHYYDLEDLVCTQSIDDLDILPYGESEEEIAWEIERLISFYVDAAAKGVGFLVFAGP